jgi:glyoxylase I family protein
MQPLGVHHVSLNVADVDEAVAFYVSVLGMQLRDDRPDLGFSGAWFDVGGQQLHLLEGEPAVSKGQHFAIQVAGLDEVVAELRADGYQVSDPRPIGTARQAFMKDPSGNLVELQEPA